DIVSERSDNIASKELPSCLIAYLYYGDTFTIECPTGSGKVMNQFEVARDIAHRLTRIFLRDGSCRRPVYGGTETFQTDPKWKDGSVANCAQEDMKGLAALVCAGITQPERRTVRPHCGPPHSLLQAALCAACA